MVGISFKKKVINIVYLESYTSYKEYLETHKIRVPLDSFICYCLYKYCTSQFVSVRFIPVRIPPETEKPSATIVEGEDEKFTFLINEYEIPWTVALCVYPVIMVGEFIITGLCAVTRQIGFFRNCLILSQEHEDGLLGFRHTCLQAPNEVSVWTKFCEIEIIGTVQELLTNPNITEVPNALVRFEDHMRQPVRIHNVYKVAQNIRKESVKRQAKAQQQANAELQANTEQQATIAQGANVEQEMKAHKQTNIENQTYIENQTDTMQPNNAQKQMNVEPQINVQTQINAEKESKVELQANEEHKINIQQQGNVGEQINIDELVNAQKQTNVELETNREQKINKEQQVDAAQQIDARKDINVKQQENCKQQVKDNIKAESENQTNAEQQINSDKQDSKESGECSSGTTKRTPKTRKWKSHKKKEIGIDCSTKLEDLEVNHEFAEGPYLTLADIVLLPSYHIIIQTIGESRFESLLPFTYKWYKNLISIPRINEIFITLLSHSNFKQLPFDNMTMPKADDVSLYECDLKRHNPKKRIYTKEEDIENALASITEGMELTVSDNVFQPSFRWKDIPEHANPYSGYLPDTRVQRKSEQLENLALAVLNMATDGDVIVDFCCGNGHLGILLAYLLPRCTIILLENKVESLGRARERVLKLRLTNVYFYQCNLDFFIGEFDIGIGLHACGIATDLILDKCLKQNARFVLSPCCYGAIHATCRSEYPRSKAFSSVPLDQYLCIAHAADQTHKDHPLANRGARCMTVIDSDRARLAEEFDYKVTLMRLKPITCTPKNNLLIGISTEK